MRTDPTPDDGRNFFRGSVYAFLLSAALWALILIFGFALAWVIQKLLTELAGLIAVLQ